MALTNFLSGPLLELTISILDPRTLTLLQEIFTYGRISDPLFIEFSDDFVVLFSDQGSV